MEIEQFLWGCDDENTALIYRLRNSSGAYVDVTNAGAAVVRLCVPDREGRMDDVVLGYKEFASYIGDPAAMGKSVGRFANRIARGRFSLDGRDYRLAVNNPPNHLHGGPGGFANRYWEARTETNRVVFSLESPDGDEGYPSRLTVEASYFWDEDNTLEIVYAARSEGRTIVNLTNHTYFNLAGENSGSVLEHRLQLNASGFLPIDSVQIPTGEVAPVEGTPMDFRRGETLGARLGSDFNFMPACRGYDHCFAVDGWRKNILGYVGCLSEPHSGRRLEIYSSQPGVQLYTGNWLGGSPQSKSGRSYEDYDGVAIECQNFPDAPNKPQFPLPLLEPGELYVQKIVWRFGLND